MVVIRLGMHEHMHHASDITGSLVLTLTRKQSCMVMLSSCLAGTACQQLVLHPQQVGCYFAFASAEHPAAPVQNECRGCNVQVIQTTWVCGK